LAGLLDAMKGVRLICVGDVMLDRFVYGNVDRISPEAPIPIVRVDREDAMLGAAGNVARNAASLGAKTTLLAVVGADPAAKDVRALARSQPGLNAMLVVDPARPTTIKTRYVAAGQQILRADREAAVELADDHRKDLVSLFEKHIGDMDIVVISDYGKGVLDESSLSRLISIARAAGKPVIADPKRPAFSAYRGVTVIKPNVHELSVATGRDCSDTETLVAAARDMLRDSDIDAALVSRSERGLSLVRRSGDAEHFAGAAHQVFDVSGAGDTVVATAGVALGAGADLAAAAALAAFAGGIVVGKVGTATVTPAELRAGTLAENDAKVQSATDIEERVRRWRAGQLTVGFTNGVFDLLHPGHVALLQAAKARCDRLIVALNSDASVRRLKGPDRPVQDEHARAIVLASLAAVDGVVVFAEETPAALIDRLRPDVLIKGADYRPDQVVGADAVRSWGGEVWLAPVLEGNSSSGTIDRIRKRQDRGDG